MNKVQAKVAELKEKMEGLVGGANYRYVTYYNDIEEYGEERGLNKEDAYNDIVDRVETIEKPSEEELEKGFMLIDESGSTGFEVVLKDDICDYKA